jgi:acetylornithine deacetylase/succinyl-diaminopimelate desuccinylase-like protein
LSSLTDRDERILVDGLSDAAAAPTDEDEVAIGRLATTFDPEAHLKEAKASRFRLEGSSEDLLRTLMFEPTVNIDGFATGYVGPGGKTIIPSEARAVLDIRLVPTMDADEVAAAVRRHLDRHGFGHVEARALDRYPWAKAPSGNAVALAIQESYRALGRTWQHYPLAPWCAPYYVFDRILGIPWASGGVGHAAGAHGPDEYATLEGLKEHIVGMAAFLSAYAGALNGNGAGR